MLLKAYLLLLSSSSCITNEKLITFDLQHGSMVEGGKILPGDHRSSGGNVGFLSDGVESLAAVEDEDVVANLNDFKDI